MPAWGPHRASGRIWDRERATPGLDHGHRDRVRHRHRHRRLPGGPAGGSLAHPADRPVRSRAIPIAGRGTGRRLRPAGLDAAEDRPPARPLQPVRPGRRAAWPSTMPASARAPTALPTPSGSASTWGRRWAASRTPRSSTSGTSSEASGAWPRTWPWPSSAARPRPTSASRSACAARSSRPPTPARRGRWRWARRSAICAKDGSTPPSPAAARSPSVRSPSGPSTSSAPYRSATTTIPATQRGRSTSAATGS